MTHVVAAGVTDKTMWARKQVGTPAGLREADADLLGPCRMHTKLACLLLLPPTLLPCLCVLAPPAAGQARGQPQLAVGLPLHLEAS